jgi:hypothetical protein
MQKITKLNFALFICERSEYINKNLPNFVILAYIKRHTASICECNEM